MRACWIVLALGLLGASPAVVALLGGHVDAVAVSPGEVAQHVAAGKLRTLAVMADQRVAGPIFEKVPTRSTVSSGPKTSSR